MEEENRTTVPETAEQTQNAPMEENKDEKEGEKEGEKKRPRNIVTDFYDSINVSVHALNVALVVLCAFILIVIIVASQM